MPRTQKKHIAASLGEVAEFFGVAIGTARKWREEGLPGKNKTWDLAAIYRWLDARAKERARKARTESPEHQYQKYKAKMMRLRFLERGRALVPRKDHEQLVMRILLNFKQALEHLSLSLGTQSVGLDQKACIRLHRERFDQLLKDLSEHAGDDPAKAARSA